MEALIDDRAGHLPLRRATFYARFAQRLSGPRAALGIAAFAFVLSLPALTTGLAADDFDLALTVTRDPFGAYAFQSRDPVERKALILAARDAGSVPWWIDPELHQAFFRPLASLSLALDFALWPTAPWLMHIENAVLFALIVLLAASLYRAFGLPPRARGVATAFFCVQASQSMTTGWISGRNTLLAALFGFLAIRLFVAARSGSRTGFAALGVFALALLSAEGGVAALAYMFAYVLCCGAQASPLPDDVRAGQRVQATGVPLVRALTALWAFAALLIVWLVAYKLGGYGVKNSGFYVDPMQDPQHFALDLLCAIPIYLASQLTLPFEAAAGAHPLAVPIVTAISLAILYATRKLWLPWVKEDARARVLGLGALLAILPLGSSVPQGRLVFFIALGVCGLLALIVEERLGSPSQLPQRGALRLFRYHALWAPALYVPLLFGSMTMIAGGGGVVLDRVLGTDLRPVLLVNAPSYLPVHFFASKRTWFGEAHPSIDVLYAGAAEIELTRSAERSLELAAAGGYFAGRFERIERDPRRRPLQVGDVVSISRMRAQVLEVADGAPIRVRFDFVQPLSDARVYAWQGRTLEPLVLPQVGQRVHIRRASAL